MIIVVDAAGGDYAPHEIVKGATKAAGEYEAEERTCIAQQ